MNERYIILRFGKHEKLFSYSKRPVSNTCRGVVNHLNILSHKKMLLKKSRCF